MASILEFIKTGKLGPISLGDSKEDVENILGDPDDVSISRKPRILRYSSLQLAFYWDKERKVGLLNSIHMYFDNEKTSFPEVLCLDGWIPDNEVSTDLFLKNALKYGINLRRDDNSIFDVQQIRYISDMNVTVIFDAKDKGYNLASIHL